MNPSGLTVLSAYGRRERGSSGRLESGRFHVDKLASHPLAASDSERGDHSLARIDGNVTEAQLGVVAIGVELSNDGDFGKSLDGLLDIVLERRRQRHGDAIVRPLEDLLAHPDREIARAVDDRHHADPLADPEEIIGGGTSRGHHFTPDGQRRSFASPGPRPLRIVPE